MGNLRYFADSSVISLLFSNILVVILAVVQKWEISTVLWVYWMQSIIIGFFQFIRILSLKNFSTENFTVNNNPVSPTTQTKTFTAFFFIFHYGFFHFLYTVFLFNFFTTSTLDFKYLFAGGSIFFINHLFSFYHNRMIDQQKVQNIGQLMFSPYVRIIPMHLIIIFGAILGQSALFVFLLLKTLADLLMHVVKHKKEDLI
ncbi:MAG: DUF6498-containing protein [Candidatus Daviesbacteria bacterium]|nr:DUF6498-containing protein [Candidatus Daviesbacteria bacterium]